MRILLINNLYAPYVIGGAERSVQFLADSLKKNGDTPVVVCGSPDKGIRTDQINGVKIYYVSIRNLYSPFNNHKDFKMLSPFWNIIDTYNLWMAGTLGRILDMERPDVVHTNNLAGFSVSVWSEVKRRNLPLIHTLRDYYLICPRSTMFHNGKNCIDQCWYCRIYAFARKRMSRSVNSVVGNSRFIINCHLNHGYFSRAKNREVIFSAYTPKPMQATSSIPEARSLRLGYLGRLTPNKGIDHLLRSLQKLPDKDYQLWIGGKGTEKHERWLKTRYQKPNIYFLGFVKPDKFFQNIDVLVVPSLWNDPLPRNIFEAYSNGVPVIGSNRGGIPEIIDIGTTGFVFDPDHPDTLLSLLIKIKQNPDLLVRMRKSALIKSQEFLPERSLSKYLDIYRKEILQNKDKIHRK